MVSTLRLGIPSSTTDFSCSVAVGQACNEPDRFTAKGPVVRLTPKIALSLSMAMHELATNAVKYGALSRPEGRVSLSWETPDGRLDLVWAEHGGPPVAPPARRGFGTRMIERALAADVDGKAELEFRPEGVLCRIEAALPE